MSTFGGKFVIDPVRFVDPVWSSPILILPMAITQRLDHICAVLLGKSKLLK